MKKALFVIIVIAIAVIVYKFLSTKQEKVEEKKVIKLPNKTVIPRPKFADVPRVKPTSTSTPQVGETRGGEITPQVGQTR